MSPIRVFVLGSCVTRDAFEFDDEGELELSFYMARTSFASQACDSWLDEGVLDKIESSFQRKMVKMDMEKPLLEAVVDSEFDFLTIDLIDDRFDLVEYHKNCFATRSVEFMKGANKSPVSRISHHSDFYDKCWRYGFENLVSKLRERELVDKIRVNEVYWASKDPYGNVLDSVDLDNLKKENLYLEKRYKFMRRLLPDHCFFVYEPEDLKADLEHKWGGSPFHYHRKFYKSFLEKIKCC